MNIFLLDTAGGQVLITFSADIGACSVVVAELWAILIGIQIARNHGFKKLLNQIH